MKKLIAIAALLAITCSVYAQRPTQGMGGFTFGLNGLANIGVNNSTSSIGSLLYRYYLSDDFALRVGANLMMESESETDDQVSTPGIKEVTKANASAMGISIGVQKALGDLPKLEPYVGADLGVGIMSASMSSRVDVVDGSQAPGQTGDYTEMILKPGSGTGISLAPLVGFNYFFTDNFAIGAEFRWGLLMSSYGQGSATTTVKSGTDITTNEILTPKSSEMYIGPMSGMGLIMFSIFF